MRCLMKKMMLMLLVCYIQILALNHSTTVGVTRTIFDSISHAPSKDQFKVFHYIYRRTYDLNSDEGLVRYRIFEKNLKLVNEVKIKDLTYKLEINKFADFTPDELNEMLPKASSTITQIEGNKILFDEFADEDDFKEQEDDKLTITWEDYLCPIRDQAGCSSCWAHAELCSISTNYHIEFGLQLNLSPQRLVDCNLSNDGCNGAKQENTFKYIKDNGVSKEIDYPYVSQNFDKENRVRDTCRSAPTFRILESAVKLKSFQFNEYLKKGTLYAQMDASSPEFSLYRSGIIRLSCTFDTNHAITVFGRGYEDGKKYILIRNSYGEDWGEKGTMKVEVDPKFNTCNIERTAYYPHVMHTTFPSQPPKSINGCILLSNDCEWKNSTVFEFCKPAMLITLTSEAKNKTSYVDLGNFEETKVTFFSEKKCKGSRTVYNDNHKCLQFLPHSMAFLDPSITVKPKCVLLFEDACFLGRNVEVCDKTSYDLSGFKVGSLTFGQNITKLIAYIDDDHSLELTENEIYSLLSTLFQKIKFIKIVY